MNLTVLANQWQFLALMGGLLFNLGVTYAQLKFLRRDLNGSVQKLDTHIDQSTKVREQVAVMWDEKLRRLG